MKISDVLVGCTYRVHVPRGDDPLRHGGGGAELARLSIPRADFDLTVTGTDAPGLDEPAVTGLMVIISAQVSVLLPAERAAALGLDPAVGYIVEGRILDPVTGQAVEVPHAQEIAVPARWLSPLRL